VNEKQIQQFNDKLNSTSLEELKETEEECQKENAINFQNFKEALGEGNCFYCKNPITHFSVKKPCLHWLLKPKGFKKKNFPILYKSESFRSLNTYLRWVANTEKVGQNINDLVEEQSSNKFIEETIRYKNLEWSFSCSKTDRHGHAESHKGDMPHFHFQMKVNSNVIINYNAFHIPFTDYDEFTFAVEAGKFDSLKSRRSFDAGMQTIFERMELDETFIDELHYAEDEATAAFNTGIFIEADEGHTISGDDIADLLEKRKRTGKSMAALAKTLPNVRTKTVVSPGAGVPEIAERSGGRKKKNSSK